MTGLVFDQQYLVAGSTLLAALPVGCAVGYPSVLLQQLTVNDSSIQLDSDTASWIGSIHGIAAIPSIIMPTFMQWRGRKIAFVIACLINIAGWILSYTASSTKSILISESIHGFGSQSYMAVGLLSMSEMLSPQTRNISMGLYLVMETFGIALVGILGSYLHWRTVSLVVSAPIIVSLIAACLWPESPSWLAYKGEFTKCTKAYMRLRGVGDLAQIELNELILAQKENLSRDKCNKQPLLKLLWQTFNRRDFYLPILHIFVLQQTLYWSGCMAHVIYGSDIVHKATQSKDAGIMGGMTLKITLFASCVLSIVLIRYCQPKKVLLGCVCGAIVGLLSASAVTCSQTYGLVAEGSHLSLYLLVGYMASISCIIPIVFVISAELMPVKHRGVGGPFYVISTCIMHTTSLKATPYLIQYLSIWGTWLLFASNAILCGLFVWKYIPETKGKTLQQLEDYYNYRPFDNRRISKGDKCMQELIPIKG